MNGWRTATVVGAAIVVIGAGVALSPVAHGQARTGQLPRIFEAVAGGSRIGVSIQDIEAVDAAQREGVTAGVVVEEVSPESPADRAGLRKGDVIVEFDGDRVRSARQFARLVQETPPGRSVSVVLLRRGQKMPVTVTPREADRLRIEGFEDFGGWVEDLRGRAIVRARPAPPPPPDPPPSPWSVDELLGRTGRLGLTLGNLSPQLAEYFGAKEGGVLVTSVAEGSVAQQIGVKAGDVITAVDGTAVRAPADVRRRLQALSDGDPFALALLRDGKPLTLDGTIERTAPRRTVRATI